MYPIFLCALNNTTFLKKYSCCGMCLLQIFYSIVVRIQYLYRLEFRLEREIAAFKIFFLIGGVFFFLFFFSFFALKYGVDLLHLFFYFFFFLCRRWRMCGSGSVRALRRPHLLGLSPPPPHPPRAAAAPPPPWRQHLGAEPPIFLSSYPFCRPCPSPNLSLSFCIYSSKTYIIDIYKKYAHAKLAVTRPPTPFKPKYPYIYP